MMANEFTSQDIARAHRHFSADCFNRTWALIEQKSRTLADNEAMLLMASASLWHWTQRADRIDRNLSVGHWQLSRVYSLLGAGDDAMRHAEQSLRYAAGSTPFYIGYAHEAIARAALVQGNASLAKEHLRLAEALLDTLSDPEQRELLAADLKSLTPESVADANPQAY